MIRLTPIEKPLSLFSSGCVRCRVPVARLFGDDIPRAELLKGMAVLRDVKCQNPYYAVFRDVKTGKLVGMQEGDYTLLQKGGNIIEETKDNGLSKPFYNYTAISDAKTGKVKKMTESKGPLIGEFALTENRSGKIVSKTISPGEQISRDFANSKKHTNAGEVVKAYNRRFESMV